MALSTETTAPVARFTIFAVPGPDNRTAWDVLDRNVRVAGDFTTKAAAEAEMARRTRRALMSPEQLRADDIREEQRKEAQAARAEGAMHVLTVLSETYPDATPNQIEVGLRKAFEENPHRMISYADNGHKRPAWFEGFNAGLDVFYGVGKLPDTEEFKNARYGRKANGVSRITSFEDAMQVAASLNAILERDNINAVMWAEDRGSNVSPRYSVVRGFRIGDPVSDGFNGDSYIAGRVVRISSPSLKGRSEAGFRIITVQNASGLIERKFWRRKLSGSYVHRYSSLFHGWHEARNPSF